MYPGDRTDVIRRLADQLSAEALPTEDIELVLRQFGCETSAWDYYDGTRRAFIFGALEQVSDEALVELDEYLLGGSSREQLDPADLPWAAGHYRLFVSHTHAHAALAGGVRTILGRWRMDAFVAHDTIEPTREWQRTIEAALGSCDALAVFLTNDFVASKWCDQEVGYCIARHIPIVPVRLEADPHGFIAKYQAATPRRNADSAAADAIFRALARPAVAIYALAGPIVARYVASGSFDGARGNFDLLQQVPVEAWTPELVEMVERASEANNQIEHAVVTEGKHAGDGMPQAAAKLLAPIREQLGMNAPPQPSIPADDDIPF
jgi:hypothetical protein